MDRLIDMAQLDGWIPIRLYWNQQQPLVDWCYMGKDSFKHSYFSQTVEECLRWPANLLFRHQTPIDVLGQRHEARPGIGPSGFIFHSSRAGSTLVSQMLAVLPQNILISEARPIDSTLRAGFHSADLSDELQMSWFKWMVSALGQQRVGDEKHLVIKFDCWNVLELPLIRRAFPEVPWIFLYRDPVEVMVSQFNQRDLQLVPGIIDPEYFGMDSEGIDLLKPEEYCARVLAALYEAGLRHHANGGMLINYRQLPEAVWSISKGFGLNCSAAEKQTMMGLAKRHSRNPASPFQDDSTGKQVKANERIRWAADRWLYPLYQELERARDNPQITPIPHMLKTKSKP